MYLSIDIGATKTLIAVFSHHGRLLKRARFATSHTKATFLSDLRTHLADFRTSSVHAVTVAIPGVVDGTNFIFGNLPWKQIDLLSPIQASFPSCPVYFVNDADLATIYESYFCSGKVIYLTFSTGIGGGIALNGTLLPESATFEPGHRRYRWDGQLQEWEDFASAAAIRTAHFGTKVSSLRRRADFKDIAARLAPGLISIITEHRPATLVIGGPLGLAFSRFRGDLRSTLLASLPRKTLPRIIAARRPTESVVYGAYLYARYKKP